MSSTKPAAPGPDSKAPEKAPEKEKPADPTPDSASDQHETSAKEAKQKGEKRKPEPGKQANCHTNMNLIRNFAAVILIY